MPQRGEPRTQARSALWVPHSRSLRLGLGVLCDLCVPSSVTSVLKIPGLRPSLPSSPKLKTENLPLTTPHTRHGTRSCKLILIRKERWQTFPTLDLEAET